MPDWGLCAAPPMVSGTARKEEADQPPAALTVTALTVTGILDWPLVLAAGGTAILVNRLTQHPAAPPPHPPATRPRARAAAIPGRGGPAVTRSDPAPAPAPAPTKE